MLSSCLPVAEIANEQQLSRVFFLVRLRKTDFGCSGDSMMESVFEEYGRRGSEMIRLELDTKYKGEN